MVLYQVYSNYGPVAKVTPRGQTFYIVLLRDLKSIFLSEIQMPYSLGIRYAASLSGSLPGLVTLLIVVLSFMSSGCNGFV